MFNLSKWIEAKTNKVKNANQKALIVLTSQLGSVVVVIATFTLGYVVKNMEDHGAQRAFSAEVAKQREDLVAECNTRLLQQSDGYSRVMLERDARLKEQSDRLSEQTLLIQTLSRQVSAVAQTQQQGLALRKAEVHAVTKAAGKAEAAAVTAVDVAKKGLTEDDRKQINAVAKGVTKTGVKK